ncbi:MAG: alpha/beta hydrolase [Nitrospinae bacterium]|nr:alpha/beta hydrolase [Nitrospinota bacterium]
MISSAVEVLLFIPLAFLVITFSLSMWISRHDNRRKAGAGTQIYWLCKEYFWMIAYLFMSTFVSPIDQLIGKGRGKMKAEKGSGPLIVILHGYLSVPTHWLILQERLRRKGYHNVVRYSYHSIAGSIEEWSVELAKQVSPCCDDGIIFIGHSMGGIVALWTAVKLPKGSVKKIITMGSPFEGTLMADLAITVNARKLFPYTPEIETTKRYLEELDKDVELICIWSGFDELVVPPESAAPARANKTVELKGLGHTGYHFEADVSRFI